MLHLGRKRLARLLHCTSGVTSIEYALIAALISTATVTTVVTVGQRIDDTFRYTLAAFGDQSEEGGAGEQDATSGETSEPEQVATKDDPAAAKAAKEAKKAAAKAEKEAAKAAAAAEKAAAKEAAAAAKAAAKAEKAAAKAAKEAEKAAKEAAKKSGKG